MGHLTINILFGGSLFKFSVKMGDGGEDLLLKLQFKVLGQLRAIFLPLLSVERVVFNVF